MCPDYPQCHVMQLMCYRTLSQPAYVFTKVQKQTKKKSFEYFVSVVLFVKDNHFLFILFLTME